MNVLNAAGTPMTRPFPCSSLAKLTLFPGEASTRSISGMLSPALTKAGAVVEKGRDATMVERGSRRSNPRLCDMAGG